MKKFGLKHKEYNMRGIIASIAAFCFILAIMMAGIWKFGQMQRMQNIDLLRQSAKKAIVQCYADEGIYPPELEYLEENYGLVYDHDSFYVEYDVFASNVMPQVDVFERK